MADVIYLWTIFTSMVPLPTPATGSVGKWMIQLPLRCVLSLWYRNSRWIGLALWLSHHLLGYPCSFFCFLSYLVCLGYGMLIILEPEKSFKNCFIVHKTNQPGPQGFFQWIFDWLKVTASWHILLNSLLSMEYSAELLTRVDPTCMHESKVSASNLHIARQQRALVRNCQQWLAYSLLQI